MSTPSSTCSTCVVGPEFNVLRQTGHKHDSSRLQQAATCTSTLGAAAQQGQGYQHHSTIPASHVGPRPPQHRLLRHLLHRCENVKQGRAAALCLPRQGTDGSQAGLHQKCGHICRQPSAIILPGQPRRHALCQGWGQLADPGCCQARVCHQLDRLVSPMAAGALLLQAGQERCPVPGVVLQGCQLLGSSQQSLVPHRCASQVVTAVCGWVACFSGLLAKPAWAAAAHRLVAGCAAKLAGRGASHYHAGAAAASQARKARPASPG